VTEIIYAATVEDLIPAWLASSNLFGSSSSRTAQQYFPLTQLQHQLPATSQLTVFFSHTTPATSSNSSPANRVTDAPVGSMQRRLKLWKKVYFSSLKYCKSVTFIPRIFI